MAACMDSGLNFHIYSSLLMPGSLLWGQSMTTATTGMYHLGTGLSSSNKA
jgi:hypothetical protein